MTWCGSHMNGCSLAAVPSTDAAHAQPTCTSRAISQAILLIGKRSTRAAISPRMTTVVPPAAALAPDMSCAIAVPPGAILCHGGARGKGGVSGDMADTAQARTTIVPGNAQALGFPGGARSGRRSPHAAQQAPGSLL